MLRCPASGFALGLDSTVFCREGQQQGARKGFNPQRKGRPSHYPLLAVLAEASFILHGWLRSGFFEEALLAFLEERALPYVIVARMTSTLKRKCAGTQEWTKIDEDHAAGEFTVQLFGWSQARRFVVVRERVRVTNRSERAVELWRDDNGRACVEQRIEELKHDLAADGFCLQPFFATEAAFLAVLFTFNRLSLYQHQTTPAAAYRQPGTLRVAVFLCGAMLGKLGREVVLKLSAAWGGLGKHNPLVAATLDWRKVASPKWVPPLDRLASGGGHI